MKKIFVYCFGIIVLIVTILLIVNGIKENNSNLTKEMKITKNYSKMIFLDYKELGLDENIDINNIKIVCEDENIAKVDNRTRQVTGINPGKTIIKVYYNNKLIEKIDVKINDEKAEDVVEEISVIIESNGNKEEKTIKVINGVLQEKINLKKDDIITIIRQYEEERSTNDYMNKILEARELQTMTASSGEKDGKKMESSTYKVLEDVQL